VKNIFFTGANGFIGKYFIIQYEKRHNIRAFFFLKDDFKFLSISRIDAVFYLSALVHKPKASKEEFEQINIQNTLEVGKKAKEEWRKALCLYKYSCCV